MRSNDTIINDEKNKIKWFTIPYIPRISEQIKHMIRIQNVRLAFYSRNKLDGIIRAQKDTLPIDSRKNVVYKIYCRECDASYVGQTSRQLKTRIKEHRNNINWKSANPSVITKHRLNFKHDFDWESVKILDNERYVGKRLISEMLYIQLQENGLNLQSDTDFLHHGYTQIIKKLHC